MEQWRGGQWTQGAGTQQPGQYGQQQAGQYAQQAQQAGGYVYGGYTGQQGSAGSAATGTTTGGYGQAAAGGFNAQQQTGYGQTAQPVAGQLASGDLHTASYGASAAGGYGQQQAGYGQAAQMPAVQGQQYGGKGSSQPAGAYGAGGSGFGVKSTDYGVASYGSYQPAAQQAQLSMAPQQRSGPTPLLDLASQAPRPYSDTFNQANNTRTAVPDIAARAAASYNQTSNTHTNMGSTAFNQTGRASGFENRSGSGFANPGVSFDRQPAVTPAAGRGGFGGATSAAVAPAGRGGTFAGVGGGLSTGPAYGAREQGSFAPQSAGRGGFDRREGGGGLGFERRDAAAPFDRGGGFERREGAGGFERREGGLGFDRRDGGGFGAPRAGGFREPPAGSLGPPGGGFRDRDFGGRGPRRFEDRGPPPPRRDEVRRADDVRSSRERESRDRDSREPERRPRISPAPRRSPPRKRSPSVRSPPRKTSPSVRHESPPPKESYKVKLEPFPFTEYERDVQSLARRYDQLYITSDFSKLVACWVKHQHLDIPIDKPVKYEHEIQELEGTQEGDDKEKSVSKEPLTPKKVSTSEEKKGSASDETVWNAKVMLMTGMDSEALEELMSDKSEKSINLLLKFVTIRKDKSAITSIGGTWDKDLDGGDPATDDQALIRTAVRATKNSTQLDLSGCKQWIRFCEVHYQRSKEDGTPGQKEVTVFFVPDAWTLLSEPEAPLTEPKAPLSHAIQEDIDVKQEDEGKEKEELEEQLDLNGPPGDSKMEEDGAQAEGPAKANPDAFVRRTLAQYQKEKAETISQWVAARGLTLVQGLRPTKANNVAALVADDAREETAKVAEAKNTQDTVSTLPEEEKAPNGDLEEPKAEEKVDDVEITTPETKVDTKDIEMKEEEETKGSELPKERAEEPGEAKEETEEEKKEKMVKIVTKRTKASKWRSMTISLDGLLDYEKDDKEECTFELSLFAELFQEMLQQKFGLKILSFLEDVRNAHNKRREDRKRRREEEKRKEEEEHARKKVKRAENEEPAKEAKVTENGETKDKDEPEQEKVVVKEEEQSVKEEKVPETPKSKEKETSPNWELVKAFQYFDVNRTGYLKVDDARRLLHNLGLFLSNRNVKDLVGCAVTESSKSHNDRVMYRAITHTEEKGA